MISARGNEIFEDVRAGSCPIGMITTMIGMAEGGNGNQVTLSYPEGLAVGKAGSLYVADSGNCRVLWMSADGAISTVAGIGKRGFGGDNGPAMQATLTPHGLAVDGFGNLFVSDFYNHRVRRVSPDGVITTVAGTGDAGCSGDGDPAIHATLNYPEGLAVDRVGNLYIADSDSCRVRRVSPDGVITTVAGTGNAGCSGDGGPATQATLSYPDGLAVDGDGNLYVADRGNRRVRRVSPDGVITTVAGTGEYGSGGDGSPATNATLSYPGGLAVDEVGNLYIADCYNCRVRRVSPDGVITTVAGTGEAAGCSGDGGPATQAKLSYPDGVAVDGSGNVYIADRANHRVRMICAVASVKLSSVRQT